MIELLRDAIRADHPLHDIPVREKANYLGIQVGRGVDLTLAELAQPRFVDRGIAVASLGLGSPHGLQLFQIVGSSVLRH
eukprot:6316444-Amphidinium_carterae.1